MTVDKALNSKFPADVVDALMAAFREIENNYALRKWKASELDAGHFVEAARRIIEQSLFGSYVPIGKKLPDFSDAELKRYEQASGDESFRLLIPRALKAIYNIRNKRGVGHLGLVSPNEMDATYIVYTAKWVLAELVRLGSGLSAAETQAAVDAIVERDLGVLWKHEGIVRVMADGMVTREEVLILLYDRSPQTDEELRAAVEYKNETNFRKILSRLHTDRLIEYTRGKPAHITSKGLIEAERILLKHRGAYDFQSQRTSSVAT